MTTETTSNRKPAFRLYIVNGEGEKAIWIPVGAAWSHQDGKGYSISLDAIPVTGRLVMRAASETSEGNGGQP
ncbi:hypothetical protein D0Z70_13920 [Sphingobium terrigena]|uniref:Uncharacterized protein n=1 Tax=Sphingobium terrigena TaxID=2304063 RepID=A0A418YRH4_9SPHN|nr:hypothetical protein [Sphingobium terrigena]RJG54224.1 hypothetical protein D0Z70_13920 [Sphingobium terrigena]